MAHAAIEIDAAAGLHAKRFIEFGMKLKRSIHNIHRLFAIMPKKTTNFVNVFCCNRADYGRHFLALEISAKISIVIMIGLDLTALSGRRVIATPHGRVICLCRRIGQELGQIHTQTLTKLHQLVVGHAIVSRQPAP